MLLAFVTLTGEEKVRGLAPETVILLAIWIRFALVKERLVKGVVPPTAPVKETVPPVPAFSVRAVAPFRVLEKLILAPIAVPTVVLKIGVLVMATGPVIVMIPPLVAMLPLTLIPVVPV